VVGSARRRKERSRSEKEGTVAMVLLCLLEAAGADDGCWRAAAGPRIPKPETRVKFRQARDRPVGMCVEGGVRILVVGVRAARH